MILCLDVGNITTTIGVVDDERLVHTARLRTDNFTADELGVLLTQILDRRGVARGELHGAICASVVPALRYTVLAACERYLELDCLWVGKGIRTGLKLRVDNPREVGADRICNAVAAAHRWGGPIVVVDFGTATTVDGVNHRNEFVGGMIAPGFRVAGEALFQNAAQLPRVEVAPHTGSVIGKNTVDAMQAGLWHATLGSVDHLARSLREALDPEARVVATGSYAPLFGPASAEIVEVDRFLTLRGLGLLYQRNG